MTPQEIFDSLGQAFGEKLQHKTEFRGETTYAIAASDLREIAKFCCAQLSFDYLLDITSIDNFGEEPRFEIVTNCIRWCSAFIYDSSCAFLKTSALSTPFPTSGRRPIGMSAKFTT